MSKVKLKPCPFCGSNAHINIYDNGLFGYSVSCDDIFGCGAIQKKFGTEKEAIEAWNRRTDCGRVKNDYSEWLQPEPAVPLTSYIRHTRAKSMEQEGER